MKQKKLPPNPLFYKLPQYHLSSLTIQHSEWCLWTQENVLLLTMTNIILTWFLWQVFNVSEGELSTRIVCIHKEMTKTVLFNMLSTALANWGHNFQLIITNRITWWRHKRNLLYYDLLVRRTVRHHGILNATTPSDDSIKELFKTVYWVNLRLAK